jgi:hypothetical protein
LILRLRVSIWKREQRLVSKCVTSAPSGENVLNGAV